MLCYEILHEKGYRLTPQRLLILKTIYHAENHISAEEIYKQLHARFPYSNISTIYRTLKLLKELQLVTEMKLDEGCIRYQAAIKGHHHHLICHLCGNVINVDESISRLLKDTLLKDYGFEADLRHLVISGECNNCRQKK
jgi:Fur family transcriptional regulator, ferric uptake regulator